MAANRGSMGEIASLHQAMNRLMGESFVRVRGLHHGAYAFDLPVDLYDQGDAYVLRAVAPGARPDDVQVTISGATVQIKGSIQMHQADPRENVSWLIHEAPHGRFFRQITLPQRVDTEQTTATFEAGILTLRLPKAADARPRQITIKS
jgi:HSP20 family protein